MPATITVRGRTVHVDIAAELSRFDWIRPRWTSDKLIAASPFRYDHSPSFFVNVRPDSPYYGTWSDSGASDPEWASGNFTKLLAFLTEVTYEEAEDYLLTTYASEGDGDERPITLDIPHLTVPQRYKPLPTSILEPYKFRHVYLGTRMISEPVQRLMSVGYDRKRHAVTIPWFNASGTLGNVKFRRTDSKIFWYYYGGGRPIRDMLYGINVVYAQKCKRAVIVEGEVDAMTFMSAGVPAIAVGGAAFNRQKAELILRSPIEQLVVATDNDPAGRKLSEDITQRLIGKVALSFAEIPEQFKDVNEFAITDGLASVTECVEKAKGLRVPWRFGI